MALKQQRGLLFRPSNQEFGSKARLHERLGMPTRRDGFGKHARAPTRIRPTVTSPPCSGWKGVPSGLRSRNASRNAPSFLAVCCCTSLCTGTGVDPLMQGRCKNKKPLNHREVPQQALDMAADAASSQQPALRANLRAVRAQKQHAASSTTHSGLADSGWGCVAAQVCLRADDKACLQQ